MSQRLSNSLDIVTSNKSQKVTLQDLTVNVVTEDAGWILNKCAEELRNCTPKVRTNSGCTDADIEYYISYLHGRQGAVGSGIRIGFYTHQEEVPESPTDPNYRFQLQKKQYFQQSIGFFHYHVGMCDRTVSMLKRFGAPSPVLIRPGTDYKRDIIFGVVGRTYKSGRKNEEFVARMQKAGFKVVAWGEGWPCEIQSNDPSDLESFYRSIDYLVVTSTNEGGPIPVIEALALGTPVVAPDVGWCWEFPVIRYTKGCWDSLKNTLQGLAIPPSWREWRDAHEQLFLTIARENGLISGANGEQHNGNGSHPGKRIVKSGFSSGCGLEEAPAARSASWLDESFKQLESQVVEILEIIPTLKMEQLEELEKWKRLFSQHLHRVLGTLKAENSTQRDKKVHTRKIEKLHNWLCNFDEASVDHESFAACLIQFKELIEDFQYYSLIAEKGFQVIERLGSGKDGHVFRCRDSNKRDKVVKVLSDYGKKYLSITRDLLLKARCFAFADNIDLDEDILVYDYKVLKPVSTEPLHFINYLSQICLVEQELLKTGFCYWDLGFSKNMNCMLDDGKRLCIVDYGGNSFLYVGGRTSLETHDHRRNLVNIQDDLFLKVQFLLHIYYVGLGRRSKVFWPTTAQDAAPEELRNILNFCVSEIKGTVYDFLLSGVINNDLLTESGWESLKQTILDFEPRSGRNTQEAADIDSVRFTTAGVEVKGYQSYAIENGNFKPIYRRGHELWDTSRKLEVVDYGFNSVTGVESLLDIGCNLGLYCFFATVSHKIPRVHGVDYNKDYIETCKSVAYHLNLDGCTFEVGSFSQLEETFDCVLAMAVIHHLYHRTETFGSLEKIMKSFSILTRKHLILEFPTENDEKAMKWTKMPGRTGESAYNQHNLLKAGQKYFSTCNELARVTDTRITYLFSK